MLSLRAVNVRVRITGGLGNQLFKFFHAINVAARFNTELILDVSWYNSQNSRNGKISSRKFELDFFPEISIYKIRDSNFVVGDRWLEIFERRLGQLFQNQFSIYSENFQWKKSTPPRVIYGNFEKLRHLPSSQIICEMLSSPVTSTFKFSNLSNELAKDNVVVFHIRRGDYLNLSDVYDVLDQDYYKACFKSINQDQNINKILVFTDAENLQLPWLGEISNTYEIIGPEQNLNSVETMLLMSFSKNLVCANSTFSWWAAYLGTISSRINKVIIPSRFNKIPGDTTSNDLFLKEWTCITPEGKIQIPSNFA